MKKGFTLSKIAKGAVCLHQCKFAFTLAEVLITLSIIGIVAALTMPALIQKITDKGYSAARKKMLATIGEGFRNIAVSGNIGDAADAKDFVENHLKKQIKILKTCDNDRLRDCGIAADPYEITNLAGDKMTMPKKLDEMALGIENGAATDTETKSCGFVMSNGYAVNLFYNPDCLSDTPDANHYGSDRVCVNAVYDMNGIKGPNEVGKDIGFVTLLYPDIKTRAVAPEVYPINAGASSFDKAPASCTNLGKDLSLPDRDELLAMYYNSALLGMNTASGYWSGVSASAELGWYQSFTTGFRYKDTKSKVYGVRCVRR